MTDWVPSGYTEVRLLGWGATGRVALARHAATGGLVAVKCLARQLRADQDFMARFRAEARLLTEVRSNYVVALYEYVETPEGAAIVTELVDGASLRMLLRESGPLAPEAALVVLRGSLLGLSAVHRHGIVHRDYKPENVLVDAAGDSKLTDFGVAVRVGRRAPVAGTPAYMAPEQWRGEPATNATDLYAAAATFFECLTGHPPYRTEGQQMLRRQHEHAPIPADEVPEEVRALVRRGLAKQPGDRPADAAGYLADLEEAASAGYGHDWAERGRRRLAESVAALAVVFPLAAAVLGADASASTSLGGSVSALTRLGGQARRAVVGKLTAVAAALGLIVALSATAAALADSGGGRDGNPVRPGGTPTAWTAGSSAPSLLPTPSTAPSTAPSPTRSRPGNLGGTGPSSPPRSSGPTRQQSPSPPPPPLQISLATSAATCAPADSCTPTPTCSTCSTAFKGNCASGVTLQYSSNISVNRGPEQVTFQWIINGTAFPADSVTFTGSGAQHEVVGQVTVLYSSTGLMTAKLKTMSPQSLTSNTVTATITCV